MKEAIITLFLYKSIILLSNNLLEFSVSEVLHLTNQDIVFSIEFESVENENAFIVLVFLPVELNLADYLLTFLLIERHLESTCFLIICIPNFERINITKLSYHCKLMEAEFHWLQFLEWLVDQVEHVWILEAVINLVTRQNFKLFRIFVFSLWKLILVPFHVIL